MKTLKRIGEIGAEQDDLPTHVDPGEQNDRRGERSVESRRLADAHLRRGAEFNPCAKQKSGQQPALQRRQESHTQIGHEGMDEGEDQRDEKNGNRKGNQPGAQHRNESIAQPARIGRRANRGIQAPLDQTENRQRQSRRQRQRHI